MNPSPADYYRHDYRHSGGCSAGTMAIRVKDSSGAFRLSTAAVLSHPWLLHPLLHYTELILPPDLDQHRVMPMHVDVTGTVEVTYSLHQHQQSFIIKPHLSVFCHFMTEQLKYFMVDTSMPLTQAAWWGLFFFFSSYNPCTTMIYSTKLQCQS